MSGATETAGHTRRHNTVRLLPFLFVLYIINYPDRISVAYAALGMSRELGFSDMGSPSYGLALMAVSGPAGGLLILCTPSPASGASAVN